MRLLKRLHGALGPRAEVAVDRPQRESLRHQSPLLLLLLLQQQQQQRQHNAVAIIPSAQYFLRVVGTGLRDAPYAQLRTLRRHLKVRPDLAALVRALGRGLGPQITAARPDLTRWQDDADSGHGWPEGDAGIATVRAAAQWVLDHAADGNNQGFPFDRPYLDLYRRCLEMRRALDAFDRRPPQDPSAGAPPASSP